jgi:hypothetical protein
VDAGAVALLALPWLLLLADPLWVYAGLSRDPWVYFGFFQNLPGQLAAFKDHYAAGRLSVLLPGWAAYSLLPPAAANLALHVGVYSVAVLSAYAALAAAVGRRAAFMAAAALGGHYFFLRAVGWDYADGYVVAYFLLATALTTRATRPGSYWKVWSAAAGAVAAAIAVAYLGAVVLLVPLAGLFVVLNRGGGRHPLDAAGFWVGAGFVGAIAGFGLASRLLGGSVVFFLPSLVYAARTFGPEAASQYIFSPREWVGRAGWLILPAATTAGAAVWLVRLAVRWRRGGATRTDVGAACFQLQMLGLAGVIGVKQWRGEVGFLQIWLAASWAVMPPAFLALGGQLGRWADGFTPGRFRAVTAAWVAVVVGGCLTAERLHLPGWGAAVPLAVALAGAVAAVLAVQVLPPRIWVGVAAAALLGLVSVSARAHFRIADSVCNPEARVRFERCRAFDPDRRACFHTVVETARWAKELAPAGRVWFWYDLNAPLGPVYDTAAHTNGHYLQIVNMRFPDLPDGKVYRGDPVQVIADRGGGAVVVLSDDPAAGERAAYWLRGCGMTVTPCEVREIGRRPVAIRATVLRVAARN